MAKQVPKTKWKKPTQERSRHTVSLIFEGTAQVLIEYGYEDTSTNLIAKKAGVSIGSLYQYFPNKQVLVGALIEQMYRDDVQSIELCIQKFSHRGFEKLVLGILTTLLKRFSETKQLRKILYHRISQTEQVQTVTSIKLFLADFLKSYLAQKTSFAHQPHLKMKLFILVNSIEATLYASIFENQEPFNQKAFLRGLKDLVILYLRPH